MAAMADGANLGGLHRGYSYTAAALHHAHLQQHGNLDLSQQEQPPQLQQPARLAGQGAKIGQLSLSLGAAGMQANGGQMKLHETLIDDRPPRVTSWGSNDIADSVVDFPATSSSASSMGAAGVAGFKGSRFTAADRILEEQASAHVGGAPGGRRARAGLLATLDSKACLIDEADLADSVAAVQASRKERRHSSSSACSTNSRASASGSAVSAPSEVLGQLDCCDSSVTMDIWSSLLPLATSALVLEAVDEGLDAIAP
jgi:hypothetical protein